MSQYDRRWGYRIHRRTLLAVLGLPDKMPRDFEAVYEDVTVGYPIGGPSLTEVWLPRVVVRRGAAPADRGYGPGWSRTGRAVKSSEHRIYVACELCRCEVPAGRYHQHIGTVACVTPYAREVGLDGRTPLGIINDKRMGEGLRVFRFPTE